MKTLLFCLFLMSLIACEEPPKERSFTTIIEPRLKKPPNVKNEKLRDIQKEFRFIRNKVEPREP
jgi:hypothetical protein